MQKIWILLLGIMFQCTQLQAQRVYRISGAVSDEHGEMLRGASVMLLPLQQGVVSGAGGSFSFSGLQTGKYILVTSFLGFQTRSDTLELRADTIVRIQLFMLPMGLQEVVVAGEYPEDRKKEESLGIEVVNAEYLKQNLAGSLMASLERLPGVSTIDIGAGQSKPVIRGLGFNRVVVVENNMSHESQQWGSDHGLETDQYAVDRAEIIKGPASLLYGSDAIGGVILLNDRPVPEDMFIGGTLDLAGKTNNDFAGSSLSLYGRKSWFFAGMRMTLIDHADYRVPTDSVNIYSYRVALYHRQMRNTAGQERNLHFSAGVIKSKWMSRFFFSSVYAKQGFFANAHGLEPRMVDTAKYDASARDIDDPFQAVHHLKIVNNTRVQLPKGLLELNVGYQQNLRDEISQYVSHGYMPPLFPDSMSYASDLELQFNKHVFSGNASYRFGNTEATAFTLGMSGVSEHNRIGGRNFLIPAYQLQKGGLFALFRRKLNDKRLIQGGVRFDAGHINTRAYADWFCSPVISGSDTSWSYVQRAANIERLYSSFSWSIGYNFNPGKWQYRMNAGKSFRIPIAKELAANGVNYHQFSYEVGNADLKPEVAYQLDAGLAFHSRRFAFEASPFVTYFSRYIYLNPTAGHDQLYGNGNQIYEYTQSRVFRYGAELHSHFEITKFVQAGLIGEYVYSVQLSGEKKGFTLPFSPPASAVLNIKVQKPVLLKAENAYLSVDLRLTSAQKNIVPPEEITRGYQTLNLSFGAELKIGKQHFDVSAQIINVFNTRYFNHTSYYRLLNVPEPGRNFILNIHVPFQTKLKNTQKN